MPVVFISTAVAKIRRLSFSRFWRACLISLHHTGTMCLTLQRFVSGSAFLIRCCCYAPCETPESVSDRVLWCLRLHYYTGCSRLTCLSSGSDHWNAAGRGGSEIHSCAGARTPMGQCKLASPFWKSPLCMNVLLRRNTRRVTAGLSHWHSGLSFQTLDYIHLLFLSMCSGHC